MTEQTVRPRRAPGPRGLETLRAAGLIRTDPRAAFEGLAGRYGDVVRLDPPGMPPYFLVNGPEAAARVLVSEQGRYRKTPNARLLARGLGQGLLANDDASWAGQRRAVQPLFARRHMGRFAAHMAAALASATAEWDGRPDGERIDMTEEMNVLSLGVAGRALFGTDLTGDAEAVHEAIDDVLRAIGDAMRSVLAWWLPARLPGVSLDRALRLQTVRWRRLDRASAALDAIVGGMVEERSTAAEPDPGDLLGLLLHGRDAAGAPLMSRARVRDELKTFLLVGHDTTATALAWTWYLLALHPEARSRLEAEVDGFFRARERSGRERPVEDAAELPWTAAVVQESMRLFPPSWLIERQCARADVIGGFAVPAGATVAVCPHLLHRDARVWPDPGTFDPARFLPGQDADRDRTAYIPFGAGRRQCIGLGFALLQATLTVGTLSRRFAFDLVPGTEVEAEATLTLRPRGGLPMVLRRRPDGAAAGR
ncbi:cytochrome P450 [Actinomadura rugatobispora]|uniref:Cytochrome P450 n=1 Tax=Actinomadura rugatobispora TaxID=1994 RepID=A0ABW0ZV46_9ACTN|nr:cytochrome P450 [Actinomadura rugatobispora]